MKNVLSFFLLVGVVTGLTTCQPHPNTSLRRFSYAFRTRYNVYYHVKKEFIQSLKELSQTTYPPDSVLQLFDGCIRKCEKAIRLYSIRQKPPKKPGWQQDARQRKRQGQTEYNPSLIHCWLLMGKAYYYNRDYDQAILVFSYIRHHFKEKPDPCTEALLWESASYMHLGEGYRAAYLLEGMDPSGLSRTQKNTILFYNPPSGVRR